MCIMKNLKLPFSDYFEALAVGPQAETPRPMTMHEAWAFHAELLDMRETLRLDDENNGCNHRTRLVSGLLAQRNFQSGSAIFPFPEGHKWTFHNVPFGIVQTEEGLENFAFDPTHSDVPELLSECEKRWIAEGAVEQWFMICESPKMPRKLEATLFDLVRLHGSLSEPAAPQ